MRPRVVAASTATLIAAASMAPMAAQATGQNTIFVNGTSSACTDSGTGTIAAPFCTLQAAADVANPGDVVNVARGTYAAATITRSGTASAPIIFAGNGIRTQFGLNVGAIAPLDLSGASHVKIENFALATGSTADAVVDGGSDVTFVGDLFRSSAEPALHVTGAASAVTVQDSLVDGGVVVDGGATGTVLTTNRFNTSYTSPISIVGAADTAITSNTIYGCGPAISVTNAATGTSIENNVVTAVESAATDTTCTAASQLYGILVDSTSASATTADYNDVYAFYAVASDYNWAGTAYSSAATLYAATKQAQHDDNSLQGSEMAEHSPLNNSANSAAIGEQLVDINGNPRVVDPLVPSTGAGPYGYYDRGATQFQDRVNVVSRSFTASATQAPAGASIALHAAVTDTWSDTFDYHFVLTGGTTVDGGTSGTANVSFSTPGNDAALLYLGPTNGSPGPTYDEGYVPITVVPQAPLVPQLDVGASGEYGVGAEDLGTTDAWNIASVTFDFGDGTPTQTVGANVQAQHTYAKGGTYTITERVTDAGGNTATKTASFTTTALPTGTLVNLDRLVGAQTTKVPAKSTGIVQSAATSLPNDTGQLVAATTSGTVEFATGTSEGNVWQAWQTLSQPGVTANWVGIAGMPNGSTQLIEITSTGALRHIIRNANGTWQSSGWGTPAGSTGFVRASITAMPDGSSQLVAVTTAGVLMHDIRNANGSWQGWRPLSQPGVKIVDASLAGLPDGSTQIVEITSGGVLKHNIRYANGHWQPSGWGTPSGATGLAQVSISSESVFGSTFNPGNIVISAVTAQGGLQATSRNADGSWNGWSGSPTGTGILGNAANSTIAALPDGNYLAYAVSAT